MHGFRVRGVRGAAVLAGALGVRGAAFVPARLATERWSGGPSCEAPRDKHRGLGAVELLIASRTAGAGEDGG